jgi:RNA recognition motif-containing protein
MFFFHFLFTWPHHGNCHSTTFHKVLHHEPPFQAATVEWATNLNQPSKKINNLMETASCSTLIIKNLPPGINQDDLRNKLMTYGNISSVIIAGRPSGRKRGAASNADPRCAFVHYMTDEDAKKAQETEVIWFNLIE